MSFCVSVFNREAVSISVRILGILTQKASV